MPCFVPSRPICQIIALNAGDLNFHCSTAALFQLKREKRNSNSTDLVVPPAAPWWMSGLPTSVLPTGGQSWGGQSWVYQLSGLPTPTMIPFFTLRVSFRVVATDSGWFCTFLIRLINLQQCIYHIAHSSENMSTTYCDIECPKVVKRQRITLASQNH